MTKKSKNPAKKYFWKDVYIGTIPIIISEYKRVLARLAASNLQMLDQQTMSQETMINAMFIYFGKLMDARGLAHLESELRDSFKTLSEWVAEDMKLRDAIEKEKGAGGEKLPDGFTEPKSKPPKGKGSPKKRRPR